MKNKNVERYFLTTLICLWIGGALIVASDVFLFNKKSNIFWYDPTQQSSVDVASLRAQHHKYMNDGIIPAHKRTHNVYTLAQETSTQNNMANVQKDLLETSSSEGDYTVSIDDIIAQAHIQELAEIAPAAGHPADQLQPFFKPLDDQLGHVSSYTPPAKSIPTPKDRGSIAKDPTPKVLEKEAIKKDRTNEIIKPISKPLNLTKSTKNIRDSNNSIKYAKPQGQGLITVIIDDMGLSLRSKLFEILPYPLTLSYLPNAKNLKERTVRARNNGHEIMLHMPMQPFTTQFDNDGKMLRTDQTDQEFVAILDWALSQIGHISGINNHMGSKLTKNQRAMSLFMQQIQDKDLYFIDSRTIGSSVAAETAQQYGIDYAIRDIFLDHEITEDFINKQLLKLERLARTKGHAIAIGHPHQATLSALKKWLPKLEKKGLTLVPASRLINRRINEERIVQHEDQRAL